MKSNGENIFVAGISTEVGKTIVSAHCVQEWGYGYWKPIQSGSLDASDTELVKRRVTRQDVSFYPETYRLSLAQSPHWAAKVEGVNISLSSFKLPCSYPLIIEGAGGLLTPINEKETMLDLLCYLHSLSTLSVLVVVRPYLGCLNHTFLTCEVLKQRGVSIRGLVISGDCDLEISTCLEARTGLPIVFHLPTLREL